MTLALYDPEPFRNDYVSKLYFAAMHQFAAANDIPFKRIDRLVPESGSALVCNADHLTPEIIAWFKQNDCPMIAFSCVDSAYLSEAFRTAPEILLIDRIFAVTGVQNTNFSNATVIDPDTSVRVEPRRFLDDDSSNRFDQMRADGRLVSLPYAPWHPIEPPARLPFEQRRPTALFRGGNHFFRVLTYLKALSVGAADAASGFHTREYFREEMPAQFRFCDVCRHTFQMNGRRFPLDGAHGECTSPAKWGDGVDFNPTGAWNNRCPASFYWLARKFQERHGEIDMKAVEDALNFHAQPAAQHLEEIGRCRFYADAKWEFSINAAQRFWEAAAVGTINLIPRRANDQDYFPAMKDGEHYLTFADDLSDFTAEIDADRFQRITDNAFAMWEHWIKPTSYPISNNLLRWIFDQCAF